MAKRMGKKVRSVLCMCDTTSNGEGTNCECWDTESNPIVLADRIRLGRKKKERFGPHPERFRRFRKKGK